MRTKDQGTRLTKKKHFFSQELRNDVNKCRLFNSLCFSGGVVCVNVNVHKEKNKSPVCIFDEMSFSKIVNLDKNIACSLGGSCRREHFKVLLACSTSINQPLT